jgi:hypothetical protein
MDNNSKMEQKDENEASKYKLTGWQLFWLIFTCLFVAISPILATFPFGYRSFENTSNFANTIGGITSPIVGLIAAFLVYRALQAQIAANEEITRQFKKQQKADYDQKKILVRQNFEQTFFNMLDLHIAIVEQLKIDSGDLETKIESKFHLPFGNRNKKPLEKRDIFQGAYDILIRYIEKADAHYTKNSSMALENFPLESFLDKNDNLNGSTYKSVYREMFKILNTDLGHYYRNLYRIVKMIHKQDFLESSEKNDAIRYFYTSIVRSQLSDYEIRWLFFNGLSEFGEKFKPLIIEYSFLKILDLNTEPQIVKLKPFYDHPHDKAFKNIRPDIEV